MLFLKAAEDQAAAAPCWHEVIIIMTARWSFGLSSVFKLEAVESITLD